MRKVILFLSLFSALALADCKTYTIHGEGGPQTVTVCD